MRSIVCLLLAPVATICLAEDPKNNCFETKLKSVSIYQSGFGYYVREGQTKLEDGWCTTKSIPTAVRGTIWVYSGDSADSIDTLLATRSNVIEAKGAEAIKKALGNKIGLDINVEASGKNFQGKLSKLLDDMLLLDIGGAFTAVPYGGINKITLVGYPLRIKLTTSDPSKVATIGMAYMQDGARWEPSYVLEINDGKPGKLTLRGNVLNLPESLSSCDLRFVVGTPSLSNRGQGETFAGNQPAEAADAVKDEEKSKKGTRGPEPEFAAAPAGLPSNSAGELFYYTKPGFTMEKSDVAMVTIFTNDVQVNPMFEWLADGEEVTYILKIDNKTGQTFTDGPVFVVENGRPIGQEAIKNTPSGATAELRLSKAYGLRTERTDIETGRGKVMTVGKTQYLPIEMKGALKITNYRAQPAVIKVSRTVRGQLGKVGNGGVVKDTQVFTGDPNAIYKVEWNVTVPANGTLTLDYEYETYTAVAKLGGPPIPDGE